MRIAGKLISGFLVLSAIALGLGAFGIYNLNEMNDLAETMYEQTMYEQELRCLDAIQDANTELLVAARAEKNAVLATFDQERQEYIDIHEHSIERLRERIATVDG